MNTVVIIGNLTRDVETTQTNGGVTLSKFTVAVQNNFSKEKDADFLDVVTWRTLAENCGKFLKKGSKVAVNGRIETNTYEHNGSKRTKWQIIANDVEFLSPVTQTKEQPRQSIKQSTMPVEDCEIPF